MSDHTKASRGPRLRCGCILMAGAILAPVLAHAASSEPITDAARSLIRWTPLMFWGAPGEFGGFALNVTVALLAMAIGSVLGVLVGIGQISLIRPLRRVCWALTQLFKNSPWLVLLFYVMLLVPYQVTIGSAAVPLPGWIKASLALSLPIMANITEVTRGALQSIPTGQWESAESLAFSRRQTLTMIILPQCIRRMLPPWMNWFAILIMSTPLMSVLGVNDAMRLTQDAIAAMGRSDMLIPMYIWLMSWFFAFSFPIAMFTRRLERRHAAGLQEPS
ncbi:amino acid ABC transporter permease [Variovorax boronicumulans]